MPTADTLCIHSERLYIIIKKALETVQQLENYNKEALPYCTDPVVHEVLQNMLDEEAKHEARLIEYYNRLRKQVDSNGQKL